MQELVKTIPDSVYEEIQDGDFLKEMIRTGEEPVRAIVEWFHRQKLSTHGKFPSVANMAMKPAEDAIRDLVGIDKQSLESVILCLNEIFLSDFFSKNILTLGNIRRKWNSGLSKYEHLLMEVEKKRENKPKKENKVGTIVLL